MIFLLYVPKVIAVGEEVVFEMQDPIGDDCGPGNYTYPTNIAFSPGKSHYDLVNFKVSEDDEHVFFDFEFSLIDNTWQADEGFSHQLIDLYINTGNEEGRTDAFKQGPNVSFSPEYPWNMYIRIAPWRSSFFHSCSNIQNEDLNIRPYFNVERIPSTNIVRATIDKKLIGDVDENWNYYVLIGAYDGYGLDCYRPVEKESGLWTFGGASESGKSPNVIDILAEETGKHSQYDQLKNSSELNSEGFPQLFPVFSKGGKNKSIPSGVFVMLGAVVLGGACFAFVKKRGKEKNGM